MQTRRLINGKQQHIDFWGFCERVSFKGGAYVIEVIAIISPHGGDVEAVKPEEVLFNLKDRDKLNDYLA